MEISHENPVYNETEHCSSREAETVRFPRLHGRLNTLDLATPVGNLGPGMSNIAIRGIRRYPELVHGVFERAGWDPTKSRDYRVRVTYPVPMVLMTWWLSLPERPSDA